jgi:putative toxin-antitoxin system antitoxin component (TIGR02293 family)
MRLQSVSLETIGATMMELAAAARVLGEERAEHAAASDVEYLKRVSEGFKLSALTRLAEEVAPGDPKFKYRIIPKASLARFKAAKRLSSQQSVVIFRIADIWAQALRIWKTAGETRDFLGRPHPLLGNRIPMDLVLENELAANLVRSVLGRLDSGSAV